VYIRGKDATEVVRENSDELSSRRRFRDDGMLNEKSAKTKGMQEGGGQDRNATLVQAHLSRHTRHMYSVCRLASTFFLTQGQLY